MIKLHKFKSNKAEVFLNPDTSVVSLDKQATTKTLGVSWIHITDKINYKINIQKTEFAETQQEE